MSSNNANGNAQAGSSSNPRASSSSNSRSTRASAQAEDEERQRSLENDRRSPMVPRFQLKNDGWNTDDSLDIRKNNWHEWKNRVRIALEVMVSDALEYLDGSFAIPDVEWEPLAHKNYLLNSKAIAAYLKFRCVSEEADLVMELKSAHEVWAKLLKRHTKQGTIHRVLLENQYLNLRFTGGGDHLADLHAHNTLFRRIWAMGPMSEDDHWMVGILSMCRDLPTLRDWVAGGLAEGTITRAKVEERLKMDVQLNSTGTFLAATNSSALAATAPHPHPQRPSCKNCGMTGHFREWCVKPGGGMARKTITESIDARNKKRIRYEKPEKAAVATAEVSPPAPQMNTAPLCHDTDGRAYIMDTTGHKVFLMHSAPVRNTNIGLYPPTEAFSNIAIVDELHAWLAVTDTLVASCDWRSTSRSPDPDALAALSTTHDSRFKPLNLDDFPFYLDSGASTHISPDRSDFLTLHPIAPRRVQGVGGSCIYATGIGQIKLVIGRGRHILLDNVLFIPNSSVRLLSISALVSSLQCKVTFNPDHTAVVHDRAGAILASGTITRRNLYKLNCTAAKTEHTLLYVAPPSTDTWHRRLGHANHDSIRTMMTNSLAEGMPSSPSLPTPKCDFCIRANQGLSPVPSTRTHGQAVRRMDIVWVDLTGPEDVMSATGNLYLMHIVDDFSRYSWSIPLKYKSDALPKLKIWHAQAAREVGYGVGIFRTDNGELKSQAMSDFCNSIGARHEFSAAHTSAHIGGVERHHRTIMKRGLAMRLQCGLPPNRWDEFCLTACYLTRRTFSRSIGKTPYEAWFDRKPDLSHLREIGSRAFVLIQDQHVPKIYARSIECILIGYSHTAKAYRCYDPSRHRIIESYHVRFIERKDEANPPTPPADVPMCDDEAPQPPPSTMSDPPDPPALTPQPQPPSPRKSSRQVKPTEKAADRLGVPYESKLKKTMKQMRVAANRKEREMIDNVQTWLEQPALLFSEEVQSSLKHSHREHILSSIPHASEENLHHLDSAFSLVAEEPSLLEPDPSTYKEARACADWLTGWKPAIGDEKQSLIDRDVFKLVKRADVPAGRRVLKGRLVFHRKRNEKGKVIRHKVRYVAKGFEQVPGLDYTDTTSPTTRPESIRTLLHTAAVNDWDIQQIDIKTAFLYGELGEDEEIYMEQIEDFDDPEHPASEWVFKLSKGLYGLKQAGRIWNKTMDKNMNSWDCDRLPSDACVYYGKRGDDKVIAAVHVDDFMSMANSRQANEDLKQDMRSAWTISDLGDIGFCLGISIRRDRPKRTISLSQTALIEKLASTAGVNLNCPLTSVPMNSKLRLHRPTADDKLSVSEALALGKLPYRQIVGMMLYISTMTRPDVAYAVSKLAQFLDCYCMSHYSAALQVVRYLVSTRSKELTLGGTNPIHLRGFSDSSWADCLDSHRSTMGYCFTLGSGVVSWSSRKQKMVTTSTTDAEYIGMGEACREAMWYRQFLSQIDLPPEKATIIYGDNNGALALSKDAVYHARSKHIDVRYHFIREQVDSSVVEVARVDSKNNLADIFTKALEKGPFEALRTQLGVL